MNVPTATPTGPAALTGPSGIPAQRTSDAFTAYASVHELGIALHRACAGDGAELHTTA